jgi:hypothetical protein
VGEIQDDQFLIVNGLGRVNGWAGAKDIPDLWRLTKQAKKAIAPVPDRIRYFIDHGKECVGLASEIFTLFEYSESDWKPINAE